MVFAIVNGASGAVLGALASFEPYAKSVHTIENGPVKGAAIGTAGTIALGAAFSVGWVPLGAQPHTDATLRWTCWKSAVHDSDPDDDDGPRTIEWMAAHPCIRAFTLDPMVEGALASGADPKETVAAVPDGGPLGALYNVWDETFVVIKVVLPDGRVAGHCTLAAKA